MALETDSELLANMYGTPLLAIDTTILDRNIERFESVAREGSVAVTYAAKALFFVALARRIAATSLQIDICSIGELVTAERAGIAPQRLVFHGCGKTREELDAAAAGRAGRVVVDHFDELNALAQRVDGRRPIDLLLRINTGIDAHTHEFVQTSGERSKFGFAPAELNDAIRRASGVAGLRLSGIHSHIGSQIFEDAAFKANLAATLDTYGVMLDHGVPARFVSIGGGFGVATDGTAIDVEATLRDLTAFLKRECASRNISVPQLGVEPGRAIVASAGTSLYRVVTVKLRGTRRFAIVDGSLADNPRPALYDAHHPPRLVSRASDASSIVMTLCGRACESDELATAPMPSDLRAGDLVAFGTTGAYTYSMASNYNRFPRPPVVFVDGTRHQLVVRRESVDEILARDLDV